MIAIPPSSPNLWDTFTVVAVKLYKDFNKNFLSLEKEACLFCQRAGGK